MLYQWYVSLCFTHREPGQNSMEDVKERDYRHQLEEKERLAQDKRDKRSFIG